MSEQEPVIQPTDWDQVVDSPPLYVYFIDGYSGPIITTEVRPGLMFDTTPDNRLVGIEVLDYERLTIDGLSMSADRMGSAK